MKILVVAHDYPFPPNHGGRLDMYQRIHILSEMGLNITLLSTVKAGDAGLVEPDVDLEESIVVKRKLGRALLSWKPLQISSRAALRNVDLGGSVYDYVLLEGEYVYEVMNNPTLKYKHLVTRIHNDEVRYHVSLSRSSRNLLKKAFFILEAVKFHIFKKLKSKRMGRMLFISRDEYLRQKDSLQNPLWMPPGRVEFRRRLSDGSSVVYVGSLFMENNIHGLRWYLDNVHPLLQKKSDKYRLIIAGNTKGRDIRELLAGRLNIDFYDSPAQLEDIYDRGAVFIAPIFFGSGVKMKVLEAIQFGLPVVTTTIGAEGTGMLDSVHLKIADTPSEFVSAIGSILESRDYGRSLVSNSQNYLATHMNQRAILESVLYGE